MWSSYYFTPTLLVLFSLVYPSASVKATDLNGAWAADASVCRKVFVKNENTVSFAPDAELYGGGLIIDGHQATGAFQNCKIKSIKDDGSDVHLIAACSTGVMVTDLKVTVKMISRDQITVSPAGPVDVDTGYVRCQL